MPVSGLVITLDRHPEARARLQSTLDRDPRWTMGEQNDVRLPVVCATDSILDHENALQELEEHPSVVLVELAFNDISDVDEVDVPPPRRRRPA